MGTRSLTVCKSRFNETGEFRHDLTIYRHWDGYPSSAGYDLYSYLRNVKLVNGRLCGESTPENEVWINGPGRLAAHILVQMHAGGHDPSVMPEGVICGQEFEYHVETTYPCDGYGIGQDYSDAVRIRVFDGPVTMFGTGGAQCNNEVFFGTIEEFGEWCTEKG